MKKFLMAVLFLIPVVVVIALNATSTIITLSTPDNPTGIEIRDSMNNVVKDGDIVKVDIKDTEEFVIINVLPTMTKDNSINVPEVISGDGQVELERIDDTNRYKLIPSKVGIVELLISAHANVNVQKALTINVTSDTIESMALFDVEGKVVDTEKTFFMTDTTQFYFDIFPFDAWKDQKAYWSVQQGDCISVTDNGTVYVEEHGQAVLRLKAFDKDENTQILDLVIDTTRAIVKATEWFTTDANVSAEWVKNNLVFDKANTVVEKTGAVYTVTYTNPKDSSDIRIEKVKVNVVNENDWGFIRPESVLYMNNGPYYLTVGKFADRTAVLDVKIESSDSDVIFVDEQAQSLIPISTGKATITASYAGQTQSLEMSVKDIPISFDLNLGATDAKRGIQLTRVWGYNFIDNNLNYVHTYDMYLKNDKGTFDLLWESSNEEFATVTHHSSDEGAQIAFNEAVCGNSVTITATLLVYNRKVDRVKKSFTFNFLEEKNAANVDNLDEYMKVVNEREKLVVMQSDLRLKQEHTIERGIYGNGFTWCFNDVPGRYYNSGVGNVYGYTGGFILDDVVVIGTDVYDEKCAEIGGSFKFRTMSFDKPIIIRYSQFKNCNRGLEFQSCENIHIEGCIFGDNWGTSIHITQHALEGDFPHQMTFKNNVFKMTQGPAVEFVVGWVNQANINRNIIPRINIEGFMDIYNWKEASTFPNIFTDMMLSMIGNLGMPDSFMDFAKTTVINIIKELFFIDHKGACKNIKPEMQHLFYERDGKHYASLGIIGLGLMCVADQTNVNVNTNSVELLTIGFRDEYGDPLGALEGASLIASSITGFDVPLDNSTFMVCANFSDGEPEIGPGDPVPSSYELYDKLTGRNQQK